MYGDSLHEDTDDVFGHHMLLDSTHSIDSDELERMVYKKALATGSHTQRVRVNKQPARNKKRVFGTE